MHNPQQSMRPIGNVSFTQNVKNKVMNNKLIIYILVAIAAIIFLVIYAKKYNDQYTEQIFLPNIEDGKKVNVISSDELPTSSSAYTLAVWFNINRDNYDYEGFSSDSDSLQKILNKNSQPTISVNTTENNIVIEYQVENNQNSLEKIKIENIDLNRWIHLAIVAKNNIFQVYMNGYLVKTNITGNTITFNSDDIKVGNSNLNFLVTQLRYYGVTKTSQEIYNIYKNGPKPYRFPDILGKLKKMIGLTTDLPTLPNISSEISAEDLRLLCKSKNIFK